MGMARQAYPKSSFRPRNLKTQTEATIKDQHRVRGKAEIVVWDVDLFSDDVVRVYRSANHKNLAVYRHGEIVDAEPTLPGWKMPVDELFA